MIPDNETARLTALQGLDILGTAHDAVYDRLVRLASTVLDVPIAWISFVDADRSWCKATVGFDLADMPRDASFCAHTILQPAGQALVVEDAWTDDRFEDNPLVAGDPHIRFYAGQPLFAPSGEAVATLSVVDHEPRHIGGRELRALADLAALAEGLLCPPSGIDTSAAFTDPVPASSDSRRLEELELILDNTTDVVVVVDPAGRIKTASGSLERLLGYGAPGVGDDALALVHADDRALASSELKNVVAGAQGSDPFTVRVLTANGSIRNMEWVAASHFDRPAVGGVVITMRDVSDRHMLSQMLSFQATHDRLTELPNRTLLEEHLRQALARAKREGNMIALCRFDLTGFQELNDELGHAAGDELLVDVARRIRSSIRTGDSAARLGGDEFAVLLEPVADAAEAAAVAQRIVNAISGPHSLPDGVSDCGANAGVALGAGDDDLPGMNSRSGKALSAARRAGPGSVEVAPLPTPTGDLVGGSNFGLR